MADLIQQYELSLWKDVLSADGSHFEEQKIAAIGSNLHTDSIHAYNVTLKENVNGEKTLTFNMLRKYQDENGELQNNPFLSLLAAERKVKFRDGTPYVDMADGAGTDAEEKWSDFIIKTVDEDKISYVNTYTCKEVFVNELGKNGWSVILSSELENNYGTLEELSNKVLEGSGWTVKDNCNPMEKITEPLFTGTFNNIGYPLYLTSVVKQERRGVTKAIIYVPYSQLESVNNIWKIRSDLSKVQIICKLHYNPAITLPQGVEITEFDDNHKIVDEENSYNYWVDNPELLKDISFLPTGRNDTTHLQGDRIVESIKTIFEPTLGKYVQVYSKGGNEAYYYIENKMSTSSTVINYLSPSGSEKGWQGIGTDYTARNYTLTNDNGALREVTVEECVKNELPEYSAYTAVGTDLIVNGTLDNFSSEVYNAGLEVNRDKLISKKQYILRVKGDCNKYQTGHTLAFYIHSETGDSEKSQNVWLASLIGKSVGNTTVPSQRPGKVDWETKTADGINYKSIIDEQGYRSILVTMPDIDSLLSSKNNKIYLRILDQTVNNTAGASYTENPVFDNDPRYFIQDIQLFEYVLEPTDPNVENSNPAPIFPGDIPQGYVFEIPHLYRLELSNGVKTAKEISINSGYTPVKNENNAAVRSIELKESNYFNNVNSLAELFGVWVNFKIGHHNNGKLRYENGEPIKVVSYSKYPRNDQKNQAGFKYGINLKSIKRNIESTAIASKVIVKDNLNEHANDGICSIRTAKDNSSKENIVYNFDYYIAHGLIDQDTVIRELYGYSTNDFGYLAKLARINTELSEVNIARTQAESALYTAEESYSAANIALIEANKQYNQALRDFESTCSTYTIFDDKGIEITNTDAPEVKAAAVTMAEINKSQVQWTKDVERFKTEADKLYNNLYGLRTVNLDGSEPDSLDGIYCRLNGAGEVTWYNKDTKMETKNLGGTDEDLIRTIKSYPYALRAEILTNRHKEHDLTFYKKFYRYIQEATWTDSKYIDSDLYYFDAVKVSAQNAWPKTKYIIGVYDIGVSEELAAYKFKVGQRSYIEDPEFFGYNFTYDANGNVIKTPIKKDVVVTERTRNFSDPSKSTITIQTYKNQYEDLFSRLNATTTSLQYASGEYQKGANVVNNNGSIAIKSLEQSFAENKFLLSSAMNDSVSWDSGKGIEVKDTYDALRLVRVTSGGIAMSSDGGQNWTTGISASGVNTSTLTAGNIAAEHINITSNGEKNFVWNGQGISALDMSQRYVRFNNYGVYGTEDGNKLDSALNPQPDTPATYKLRAAPPIDKLSILMENTNFALTWKGLSINDQRGGVKLLPYEGLFIGPRDDNGVFQKRVHLGLINEDESIYGLKLFDKDNNTTLEQDDKGNLSITGTIYATNGSFTGDITALNGQIKGELFVGEAARDSDDYYVKYNAGINSSHTGPNAPVQSQAYAYWAGIENPEANETTPPQFYVDYNGFLHAKNAELDGIVTATEGYFNGSVYVGSKSQKQTDTWHGYSAGINSLHAIPPNEEEAKEYAFWAGANEQTNYATPPNFYVQEDGTLYAKKAIVEGEINATSGTFSGTLIAESGEIYNLRLSDDIEENSYIGSKMPDLEGYLLSINNKRYLLDKDGNSFGKTGYFALRNGGTPGTKEDYLLRMGEFDDYGFSPVQVFSPNGKDNSLNKVFAIDSSGNIDMSGTLKATNLSLIGTLKLYDAGDSKIPSMRIEAEKGGARIVAGTDSDISWSIDNQGNAKFNNIEARGKLSAVVFERKYVTGVGGTLRIAPSLKVEEAGDIVGLPDVWKDIKIAYVTRPDSDCASESIVVVFDQASKTYKIENTKNSNGKYNYEIGTTIVAATDEQCSIVLTADGVDGGPYIEMLHKTNGTRHQVVLGNLNALTEENSLASEYFGNNLGYGLYADNAYLTGKLYLPKAGITNEGDSNDSVRIWAGTTPNDRVNAPFKVTQDGSLYASKGIFSGQVQAQDSSFSGRLSAAGVVLSNTRKNLITQPYVAGNSLTAYGVTFTVLEDGSIEIDGENTESSTAWFCVNGGFGHQQIAIPEWLKPGNEYHIDGSFFLYKENENGDLKSLSFTDQDFIMPEGYSYYGIFIGAKGKTKYNKMVQKPVFREASVKETDPDLDHKNFSICWNDNYFTPPEDRTHYGIANFSGEDIKFYKNFVIGLEGDISSETGSSNPYYTHNSISTKYLEYTLDNNKPRLITNKVQITDAMGTADNEGKNSIAIEPSLISFVQGTTGPADSLLDTISLASLGIVGEENNKYFAVQAEKIAIERSNGGKAFEILPGEESKDSQTAFYGTMVYNDIFEIKQVADGLIFNYIGQ